MSKIYTYIHINLDKAKKFFSFIFFQQKDVFCPHQLNEWNWDIFDGNDWYYAGKDLGISCKYIFVKHNQNRAYSYCHTNGYN